MAEKDDHQNLGDAMRPPQYRFLLVLFSGPPDIVPWQGIGPAQFPMSNDVAVNIIHDIHVSFTYSVTAS